MEWGIEQWHSGDEVGPVAVE